MAAAKRGGYFNQARFRRCGASARIATAGAIGSMVRAVIDQLNQVAKAKVPNTHSVNSSASAVFSALNSPWRALEFQLQSQRKGLLRAKPQFHYPPGKPRKQSKT